MCFNQDIEKCRDVLLGRKDVQWQQLAHLPSPALFHDRKNTNFFQGLWRIPVGDIDRAGSFATHMAKCVTLMLDVLVQTSDYRTLYHLHLQLNRTPEIGKLV